MFHFPNTQTHIHAYTPTTPFCVRKQRRRRRRRRRRRTLEHDERTKYGTLLCGMGETRLFQFGTRPECSFVDCCIMCVCMCVCVFSYCCFRAHAHAHALCKTGKTKSQRLWARATVANPCIHVRPTIRVMAGWRLLLVDAGGRSRCCLGERHPPSLLHWHRLRVVWIVKSGASIFLMWLLASCAVWRAVWVVEP